MLGVGETRPVRVDVRVVASTLRDLVADAQQSKSRAQHLADRAAQMLTGVAVAAGVVTLVTWQLIGAPIDFAIIRTVTVLVIACPHALGLAVPLVVAISTTLGAQNGLLVRDRRGLEEARNLDVEGVSYTNAMLHSALLNPMDTVTIDPSGALMWWIWPSRKVCPKRRRCASPPVWRSNPSTPSLVGS